jgi:SPP1 gp7 family putative phage head morphogenesis protein
MPFTPKVEPIDEVIKSAKSRGAVLPADFLKMVEEGVAADAFTVANMASLSQIMRVLDSLVEALMTGMSFGDWQKSAASAIDDLTTPHQETIFRNFLQSAYNAGKYAQFQKGKQFRPVIMYDAINDSRTRPHHAAMDGFMALVDDPVWDTWLPPNGHNCRCTVMSLTRKQADARGFKPGRKPPAGVEPDKGWGYSPSKLTKKLNGLLEDDIDSLPPDMRSAVRKAVTSS